MPTQTHTNQFEYWFVFQHDRLLLVKDGDAVLLPNATRSSILNPHLLRQHKLGQFNQADCYCAEIEADTPLPADMVLIPLRKAFELLSLDWYGAGAKAYSVINWDKNHQFCGRCGSKTLHKPGTFERLCNACGLAQYPRISPSIIVLIQKDDQVLMARSPHFPAGAFALIAGFVEAGESIEDAVHRETKEEVNLTITNLQYFGSQSWPFPDSLMIGFTADYAAGEIAIDHQEIESAGWYRFDNLPGRPSSSVSIAHRLIEQFVSEQKQKLLK